MVQFTVQQAEIRTLKTSHQSLNLRARKAEYAGEHSADQQKLNASSSSAAAAAAVVVGMQNI